MSQKKSLVWSLFDKCDDGYAQCKLCQSKLKMTGSSTSSLNKHIKGKHPTALETTPETTATAASVPSTSRPTETTTGGSRRSQTDIAAAFQRAQFYPRDSSKKKALDQCLLRMIARDMQPFSVVEDAGFRDLVHNLDPRYELPNRKRLSSQDLPQTYARVANEVKTQMEDAIDIALSTDIWSSRKTEGYLTLTAHFVSSSWELQSVVLNTTRIRNAHTGENIKTEIETALDSWGIKDKVSTLVTNNGANIVSAAGLLRVRHVPCFAHTLNLIVKDSLKKVMDVTEHVKRVKAIVSYFHHSVKASDKLQESQKRYDVPEHKLIMDVETRWNSTMSMLRRYVEQHLPVTAILCMMSKREMCVSDDDVAIMKKVVEALEPFEEATTNMSSETEPTFSKMIPIINMLHMHLSNVPFKEFPLVRQLDDELRRRFVDLRNSFFTTAATLLDPCFKRIPFAEGSTTQTENRLSARVKVHLQTDELQPVASTSTAELQSESQEPPAKTRCLWDRFDQQVEEAHKRVPTTVTGPIIELRRYFEMPVLKRNEEKSLQWWKTHEQLFPGLSKKAKKLLHIPATSVPSERIFSKTGELISAKRSCLKESMVDKLIFLNKNLK